ncbi:MAG: SagB/ThcOx family dehydrogenase [Cytophagales bacterium]|nr:SagB/ThcOx family dehydrogenase [Cytophagales bacterium]
MKIIAVLTIGLLAAIMFSGKKHRSSANTELKNIKLPSPVYGGETSIEEALKRRRSVREYSDEPLTLTQVSQILWAAQGITDSRNFRTAPSAGALYPLEVYLVVGNVQDLPEGVYRYQPNHHELSLELEGDKRKAVAQAALLQNWMTKAPVILVIAAVYGRTTIKYGARGKRYVHMEAGHTAQNVYLQAMSLNLGTVIVGAFVDQAVKNVLTMKKQEQPLAIMPIGSAQ